MLSMQLPQGGSASIEVPPNNASLSNGAITPTPTGITVPGGSHYVKVTLSGNVSIAANPEYVQYYCSGRPQPCPEHAGKTVGPGGLPVDLQLHGYYAPDAGGYTLGFAGSGTGSSSNQSFKVDGPGKFFAGRNGIAGAGSCISNNGPPCPGGGQSHFAHAYNLSGQQTVTVEFFAIEIVNAGDIRQGGVSRSQLIFRR